MAKPPNKAKTAAPAQFDMNSRDRKGGKGGGRGRDEKRPPSRIVTLPPSVVDRGEGWTIRKIGRIDEISRAAAGAVYELVFEGHDPIAFDYLSAARDRAKEPPPEKPPVVEEAGEAVAPEATAPEATDPEPTTEEATAGEPTADHTPA